MFRSCPWTIGRWQQATGRANIDLNNRFWLRKGWRRLGVRRQHEIVPNRPCTVDAAHIQHGGVIGVTDPNPNDPLRGIANRPVVAPIGRRAGLDCSGKRQVQHRTLPKRRNAGDMVRQNVGNEVSRSWRDDGRMETGDRRLETSCRATNP